MVGFGKKPKDVPLDPKSRPCYTESAPITNSEYQMHDSKVFSKVFSVVGFCLLAVAILAASWLDYQDELAEQRNYCTRVEMKLMPDYKHIYQSECVPLQQSEKK